LFESAPLLQALTAPKSVPAGTTDDESIRAKLIAVIQVHLFNRAAAKLRALVTSAA
jgi:hypothetical protein